MNDIQTGPTTAPQQPRPETVASILGAWRAAGGTTYSAPKGEMAVMLQSRLLAFLGEFLASADRTMAERAGPGQEQAQRLHLVETALARLVKAVCPGLDHNDLLADAGIALAAMASAEPAGYFAIDDEPAADGSARYLHIGTEHATDEDVFPLYRRAPTVAELAAHIDQHQVADSTTGASSAATVKSPAATKKAATK